MGTAKAKRGPWASQIICHKTLANSKSGPLAAALGFSCSDFAEILFSDWPAAPGSLFLSIPSCHPAVDWRLPIEITAGGFHSPQPHPTWVRSRCRQLSGSSAGAVSALKEYATAKFIEVPGFIQNATLLKYHNFLFVAGAFWRHRAWFILGKLR